MTPLPWRLTSIASYRTLDQISNLAFNVNNFSARAYHALAKQGVVPALCMAHARRKLFEVHKLNGSEMGHMFYNEFGATAGQSFFAGSNAANLALFTNVQSGS